MTIGYGTRTRPKLPDITGNEYALTYGGQTSRPTAPHPDSMVQQVGTHGSTPLYGMRINENPVDKQTQQIPGTYMGVSGHRYNDPLPRASAAGGASPTALSPVSPPPKPQGGIPTVEPRGYGMGVLGSGGGAPMANTKPPVPSGPTAISQPDASSGNVWMRDPVTGQQYQQTADGRKVTLGDMVTSGTPPKGTGAAGVGTSLDAGGPRNPVGGGPTPPVQPANNPLDIPPLVDQQGNVVVDPANPNGPPGVDNPPLQDWEKNAFPNPGDKGWFIEDQRKWWDSLSDEEKAELGIENFDDYLNEVLKGMEEDFSKDPNAPGAKPPNQNNPGAGPDPRPGDEVPPGWNGGEKPDFPGGPDPSRPADPNIPYPGGFPPLPPVAGGGGGGAPTGGGGGGFPPGFNPDPLQGLPVGGGTIPTGGAGGSGNNQLIAALLADYERARREGKQANEDRFKQLIDMLTGRYDRGLNNLEGAGEQALADVDQDYERFAASLDQDMISRGLRNSTVRQSVQRGAQEDRQANRRRVQEDVRKERAQTDAVLSGDIAGAVERRTDDYPSSSELIALAMKLGQGGYYPTGGGGGGGNANVPFFTTPNGLVTNPNYVQPKQPIQYSNPFALNNWAPTGIRWA